MTAGAKSFEIMHDKIGPKAGASGEDKVGLEGPGNGVGTSDVPSAPAMGNGVGMVFAGAIQAAIMADGAVEKRMKDVESVSGVVTKEGGKECTLKALGVDADTNDGVGRDVKAKNEEVLGTEVPAARLAFVVTVKTKGHVKWNAPSNGGGRAARSRWTGGPELDMGDVGGQGSGLGMRVENYTERSVCDRAVLEIVPESRRRRRMRIVGKIVRIGPDGDTLIVMGQ
jgi:hypothetical protein